MRAHDGALTTARSLLGEGNALHARAHHGARSPLPHRCALSLLGEVSLAAEPLSSLSRPLPSMAWALQGGAVALVEAWTLHTATSALIRAVPGVAARPPDATPTGTAADDATSTGTGSSPTDDAWASVSRDFWVGFAAAAPPVPLRIADAWEKLLCALEVEKALSTALVGCSSPAFLGLLIGRVAMVLITALALHADVQFGILHDVFSRGNMPLTARERRAERTVTRPGALAPPRLRAVRSLCVIHSVRSQTQTVYIF